MKLRALESFLIKERRPKWIPAVGIVGVLLWLIPIVARVAGVSPFDLVDIDPIGILGLVMISLRLVFLSFYGTFAVMLLLTPFFIATGAITNGRDLLGEPVFWVSTLPLSLLGFLLFLRCVSLSRKKKPNQSLQPTGASARG
jgi:hypothetical protein